MSYKKIILEITDNVAVLTLNQPEKLNALSVDLLLEFRDAVESLEHNDDARCLLLTGAGRAFCAGADLTPSAASGGSGDGLVTHYHPITEKLRSLPMPVISAVNGPAAGAGMSIAITPDLILAGRSAYFLQAFRNIGLIPDVGSTWLLPRLIGHQRTVELMFLGERLPAEKAQEWGLVYRVYDDDKLMEEAMKLARFLAHGPTRAYTYMREALRKTYDNAYSEQLELEARLQGLAGRTEDAREGALAFIEKREAVFKGR